MESITIQRFFGERDSWAEKIAFYGDTEELLFGEIGSNGYFFCIDWRNPPVRPNDPNCISSNEFLQTPVPADIDPATILHENSLNFPMPLPQCSDYVLVRQQNSTHGIGLVYDGDRIWDFFWDEKECLGSYLPTCYGACLLQNGHVLAISCSTDDGDGREEPEIHLFDMQKLLTMHASWRRRNYTAFLSMCGFYPAGDHTSDHIAADAAVEQVAASTACLLAFNCRDIQLYIEYFI